MLAGIAKVRQIPRHANSVSFVSFLYQETPMPSLRYAREKCAKIPLCCLTPEVRNVSTPQQEKINSHEIERRHPEGGLIY